MSHYESYIPCSLFLVYRHVVRPDRRLVRPGRLVGHRRRLVVPMMEFSSRLLGLEQLDPSFATLMTLVLLLQRTEINNDDVIGLGMSHRPTLSSVNFAFGFLFDFF